MFMEISKNDRDAKEINANRVGLANKAKVCLPKMLTDGLFTTTIGFVSKE